MVHTMEIKVRGYHIDVFGHVNNARYLEFLEEARWAAFEAKADLLTLATQGLAFNVVNININYRRPAVINETLLIETHIKHLGRRSGVIRQAVKLKGADTLIADADVTFVIFDQHQQRSAVFEGKLLTLLKNV